MMHLVIDGEIFLLQRLGGISVLEREILPLMCEADPQLQVDLLLTGRPRAALPHHPRIRHHDLLPIDDLLRPRRFWAPLRSRLRRLLLARAVPVDRTSIWHGTFYAPPPTDWPGRSVATLHDLIHEQFPAAFRGAYNRQVRADKAEALRRADRVICVSAATATAAVQYFQLTAQQLRIVPSALDAGFLHAAPANAQPHGQPFLLYVGQRSGHKNFSLLLSAYAQQPVSQRLPLVVVGPPWTRAEQRLLQRDGLNDTIQLQSQVDQAALRRLYRSSTAVILPSLAEGFGIPVLETLASATALVASDIPSTRELAGDLPYYFRPDDAQELLRALQQALSDPAAAARRAAGPAVAARYSWQRSARETLAVYRELAT